VACEAGDSDGLTGGGDGDASLGFGDGNASSGFGDGDASLGFGDGDAFESLGGGDSAGMGCVGIGASLVLLCNFLCCCLSNAFRLFSAIFCIWSSERPAVWGGGCAGADSAGADSATMSGGCATVVGLAPPNLSNF